MNNSWSGPSGSWARPSSVAPAPEPEPEPEKAKVVKEVKTKVVEVVVDPPEVPVPIVDAEKYNALIVDSGAIIKHTGFSTLHNSAEKYYTVQGVIDEIRDSKARSHLESLPFDLEVREPTAEGLAKVVDFSKKTGDYASLSAVDMHILALQYDLEKEGCDNMEHIRRTPKRTLQGKITSLNENDDKKKSESSETVEAVSVSNPQEVEPETGAAFFQGAAAEVQPEHIQEAMAQSPTEASEEDANAAPVNKSWAKLVNPTAAEMTPMNPKSPDENTTKIATKAMTTTFGSMKLGSEEEGEGEGCGQFSDAEDDESLEIEVDEEESVSDDDEFASIGDDFSDEECDVYILDPEEYDEKLKCEDNEDVEEEEEESISEELDMEFPSLSAALTVPYEGSDDEDENDQLGHADKLKKAEEEFQKRRAASLQPVSGSGKIYNSFRKYKDIVSSDGVKINTKKESEDDATKVEKKVNFNFAAETSNTLDSGTVTSRVIGGAGFSGQSNEVTDDGEGWVTSTKEIFSMKAAGKLDPFNNSQIKIDGPKSKEKLPSKSCRAACATTDFAMQNVILQMNLELLSVDGMKLRKLKSWVTRCGSCFKVYTGSDNDGKRLFCDRCGSASLQRIAASVNGKTGRLKLHLKKGYKNKTRGTQFALPKPGSQNKFMGDLLLSEDQLMYGAWNQRVKRTRSKKEKESIFGADIAFTVGVHTDLSKRSDIKVGFGRKNPNSSKFGRERRGKKKKSTDKACGLRRY
eukprot:CAMPEP_0194074534 /NCGR_PEP_ID=MMETSP0149-20130528/1638_1 /TAXON_ID=122233 /ORGANISM="Chaetoceros debilis, Strain MM31A-1" /LENGTH=746 /DNA_ID=CAMNT_0038754745 /DNA_START=61 /DNA_END=2301 /DNA_ORIENTATION=-